MTIQPEAIGTLCPNQLVAGDREFGGHGPRITCNVWLGISSDGARIEARVRFNARETAANWSETTGEWTRTVWTAPAGKRILSINSQASSSTDFVSPAAGFEWEWFCNDGIIVEPPINGSLVSRFQIIGDTGNSDISSDENCQCETQIRGISFNQVSVTLTQR